MGRNADLLPLHVFSFLPLNLHFLSQKKCFFVCITAFVTSVEKILIKTASEKAPQLVPSWNGPILGRSDFDFVLKFI